MVLFLKNLVTCYIKPEQIAKAMPAILILLCILTLEACTKIENDVYKPDTMEYSLQVNRILSSDRFFHENTSKQGIQYAIVYDSTTKSDIIFWVNNTLLQNRENSYRAGWIPIYYLEGDSLNIRQIKLGHFNDINTGFITLLAPPFETEDKNCGIYILCENKEQFSMQFAGISRNSKIHLKDSSKPNLNNFSDNFGLEYLTSWIIPNLNKKIIVIKKHEKSNNFGATDSLIFYNASSNKIEQIVGTTFIPENSPGYFSSLDLHIDSLLYLNIDIHNPNPTTKKNIGQNRD